MDKKQIEELQRLMAIKKADRTEAQQKRFDELFALAEEKGVDLSKLTAADDADTPEPGDGLSEEEVKKLVADGVSTGLKNLGIDAESIKQIQDKLDAKSNVTADDIQATLKEVLGKGANLSEDGLKKLVEDAAAKAAQGGLSKDQLEEMFKGFKEDLRTESKHLFPVQGQDHFPIEHRSGNLSVGQKQLLNIMLGSVSEEVLENVGKARPKGINDGISKDQLERAQAAGRKGLDALRSEVRYGKALTSTGSGSGDELVPSDLSSDLHMRLYLESQVAAEMVASEVNMPTNPFTFPLVTTRPTFKVGSENPGSDPAESSPGTGNIVFNAAKLIGMTNYSYEADEDSIIAILPMVTEQLAAGAAQALEQALISGDTTSTHQDSDIHSATAHAAKLFKGLRKYAIAGSLDVDLSTGGISAANILALRKTLGKYGVRPSDLMLIFGVNGYNDVIGLSETLTAEKVGSNAARILTGEAPSIYGIRIVVSSEMREDVNANGVYDGTTVTKGTFALVHKPSWMLGVKRGFMVEVDVDKKRQINSIVASFRRDFKPIETPSSSVPIVALGYNYNA